MLPESAKPAHLLLVNSFFRIEPAKRLPPNVAAIRPLLADELPPIQEPIQSFVLNHRRILYIALGTRALLPKRALLHILQGAIEALQSGFIDGVIWSIRALGGKMFNLKADAHSRVKGSFSVG